MPRISVGRADLDTRPHFLYRFYDRTGVLLYIGITVDFTEREKQHAKSKEWWARVDRNATRVDYHLGRRAVLDAEREAIKVERPLENDQHNEFIDDDSLSQAEIARLIIDEVASILGSTEVRIAEGFEAAQAQFTQGECSYGPTVGQSLVAALQTVEALARDVIRFRRVAQMILEAVPEEFRWAADEETEHDYYCAGDVDAPWEDRAPDQLRHLSAVIADAFNRDRPRARRALVAV